MKILRLTAENIKKIKVVDIAPDGSVVTITGANGSGKSSVLDAIFYALAGTRDIPSQPIRRGTQKASIQLDLGEIKVIRKFTAAGTSLVVEAADGAQYKSPQKMLDDLLGALTFDPLAFSRMEPKQQLNQLRGLVTLDVDIDQFDAECARAFAERTDVNRRVKQLAAQVEALPERPDLPEAAIDISDLLEQMEQAGEHNADIERRRGDRLRAMDQLDRKTTEVLKLRAKAEELRKQMEANLEQAQELESWVGDQCKILDKTASLPEPIDTAELRYRVEAARAINAQIEERERRGARQQELFAAQQEADNLTSTIEFREQQKRDAIARAQMPVDGLSFGDGEVLYNGLPFDQASDAERLRVSMAIAMKANPKLRVLRVKNGSDFDSKSLALVAEMALAEDYQVWIEKVDESGKVGIVMEDGCVVGAEAEPLALV